MINNLLKVLICTISIGIVVAGTDGQIRGKVANIEGESLVGAQIYIESLEEYDQIEFLKTVGYLDQTFWFYDELAGKHFGLGIRSRQGHCQLLLRFFTDHIEVKNGDMFSLFFKDNTGLSFLIDNTPKRKDKYNISYYQCELNFNEIDLDKLSSHSVVGWCYYQPGMPLEKSPFELEDQSILQPFLHLLFLILEILMPILVELNYQANQLYVISQFDLIYFL